MLVLTLFLAGLTLWAILSQSHLYGPMGLYMLRFRFIDGHRWGVRLHMIAQADLDRHPHDHPWDWARSYILWGGYTEYKHGNPAQLLHWRRGMVNTLRAGEYHQIVHVKPWTWTLVITGPRTRSWGFLVKGKHVDQAEYRSWVDP